jgi:hypothetical protein
MGSVPLPGTFETEKKKLLGVYLEIMRPPCEGDLSRPKRSGREKVQIDPILGEKMLIFNDLVT